MPFNSDRFEEVCEGCQVALLRSLLQLHDESRWPAKPTLLSCAEYFDLLHFLRPARVSRDEGAAQRAASKLRRCVESVLVRLLTKGDSNGGDGNQGHRKGLH